MSSNLEEITVQCNFEVVLELREHGYHMFKQENFANTWTFRVTDSNQFMDKFLKITNPMDV